MNNKLKFYLIADTSNHRNTPDVTIEAHVFNWDDEEDREAVEDTTPDEEELTQDNFEEACRNYLYEERVMEYQQGFMAAMISTEEQFKTIQNYKGA